LPFPFSSQKSKIVKKSLASKLEGAIACFAPQRLKPFVSLRLFVTAKAVP